ncbi:MAG: PepSY-like domain-containing protein [Bacteroidia bacterium]|nr:PepSY-like domain-containing protein [Bacteroidia bacterium]
MKNILLSMLIVALAFCSQAQESKSMSQSKSKVVVPSEVKAAFAKQFPTVKKVKWGIEKPGEYEAEFLLNKSETSALFDKQGNLLEEEKEMGKSGLPQAVNAILEKDYAGYKIGECSRNIAKGVTTFEVEAKKGKERIELIFDEQGKFLRKEVKNNERD